MKQKIKKTIRLINERYGTCDPQMICEILGISIINTDLPSSTKGFFISLSGKKAIVVNSSLSETDKKYCLAHELGHAFLHEHLNWMFLSQNALFVREKYEREADLFAAYLLLGEPNREKLFGKSLLEISKSHNLPISSVNEWACFVT